MPPDPSPEGQSGLHPAMPEFRYEAAFERNLGWVTSDEQQRLRDAHVAIAGLGGVGGRYAVTLARLGVGRLSIADFDTFEVHNMNRQTGARLRNMGRSKLEVIHEQVRDINPEIQVRAFPEGVMDGNLDAFLDGADIYLDGLDFFALDIRRKVFRACREAGIVATTVAPLGMGAALLNFSPKGMSFDDYFGIVNAQPPQEQALRLAIGLAPAMLQFRYLVDRSRVDFAGQRGPSTPMACELCAGIAITEALKVLLCRGRVLHAPWGRHFDAYLGTLRRTWRPFGHRNPLQQALFALGRRHLEGTA